MSKYIEQFNASIEKILGNLINKYIELPNGCLASITDVQVIYPNNLVKIGLSIFPKEYEQTIYQIFTSKAMFLRKKLSQQITQKKCPEIKFYLDKTEENMEKLMSTFDRLT